MPLPFDPPVRASRFGFHACLCLLLAAPQFHLLGAAEPGGRGTPLPEINAGARLVLTENWASGVINQNTWYAPRNQWGTGNHGVTRDNVRIERDQVAGREQFVLVCQANGDRYEGPVAGVDGQKTRVGGVLISKDFFASGRFEVVMKFGHREPSPGGPADSLRPKGMVPALWTYAYRFVTVPKERADEFVPGVPLYNPHLKVYGRGANEYWSELDFPELGKGGVFDRGLYNAFVQNRADTQTFDLGQVADGDYHIFTTDWRTKLVPIKNIKDSQVVVAEGFWWIRDKAVPFAEYLGNPLKRLGKDRYAVYAGDRADHWIDGRKVGENARFVPAMAAQLTMGVWLPGWAGPADWATATASFASIKVWQYDDPGDVRTILTGSLQDQFDASGRAIAKP